jgi:hypothetical protein
MSLRFLGGLVMSGASGYSPAQFGQLFLNISQTKEDCVQPFSLSFERIRLVDEYDQENDNAERNSYRKKDSEHNSDFHKHLCKVGGDGERFLALIIC